MLNSSEAIYGFCAWLTCRSEKTVMSASNDAAPIVELIKQFCEVNYLPEISKQWPNNLIHPSEKLRSEKNEHRKIDSNKG